MPRYRMGAGFLYDTYDIKRFQDRYLNPRLVTIADLAHMTGLNRANVHRRLHDVRDTVALAKGNKDRRIGALYDLDSPVLQHLFGLWGWDKLLEERGYRNEQGHYTVASIQHQGSNAERNIEIKLARRTRSEQGR